MVIQYSLDKYQFANRDDFLQAMTDEMKQVNQSFFRLGMYLTEAYQRRYNNGTGYDDFFEWCDDLFGLQKSSVYNLMRVYCVFRDKKRSDVGLIDERYSNFSQSQLVELLPAADDLEKLSFVKPSDSVATIRNVVKVYKKIPNKKVNCTSSREYIVCYGSGVLSEQSKGSASPKKINAVDARNSVYFALKDKFHLAEMLSSQIANYLVYDLLHL